MYGLFDGFLYLIIVIYSNFPELETTPFQLITSVLTTSQQVSKNVTFAYIIWCMASIKLLR